MTVFRLAASLLALFGLAGCTVEPARPRQPPPPPPPPAAEAPSPPPSQSMSPFGTTQRTGTGFEGTIYFVPPGTQRLPDFRALQPVGKIYAAELNITPRNFRSGFPGVSNRFEWFAIVYRARFRVDQPGPYTFAVVSDDGAKLFIDGRLVVDNDGVHPPRRRVGQVQLAPGVHEMEVQYFQGPRYQVALQVLVEENGAFVPFRPNL